MMSRRLFGKRLFAVLLLATLQTAALVSSFENTTSEGSTTSQPTTETSTTTTTTTTTTTASPQEIDKAKKEIQEHITTNLETQRLVINKSSMAPQASDFAADSPEARVADATTQFGLQFVKSIQQVAAPAPPQENVVISPLSLQNLLNMILLGASDSSETQRELAKVLGYETVELTASAGDRVRPHEAMRSVLDSINRATHLPFCSQHSANCLLNTNEAALKDEEAPAGKSLVAHLQTAPAKSATETPLSGQVNFTLANLMLTNKDRVELKEDYAKELAAFYGVRVEEFSSKSGGNNSKQVPLHERVNSWVRNMTSGQISKLADEADLQDNDLVAILLNAAHFKGRWLHQFNTRATHERLFYSGGLESGASEVEFMRQKASFGYADFGSAAIQAELAAAAAESGARTSSLDDSETLLTEDQAAQSPSAKLGAQTLNNSNAPTIELSKEESRRLELTSKLNCSALMLPFSLNDGEELSMVVLLPTRRDGLDDLINLLSATALKEIYNSLVEQQVQVELPKFSFEASYDAKSLLVRSGLSRVFGDSAELDRMFKQIPAGNGNSTLSSNVAKVDKVIHKAKVSVDEQGAEAAAASMATIVLRNSIRQPPTPVFVADRPFLFVIRHNRSNMPLFMGRVNKL